MHCDCSRQGTGWQGHLRVGLAGRPLFRDEEGKRGGLVPGVEAENGGYPAPGGRRGWAAPASC